MNYKYTHESEKKIATIMVAAALSALLACTKPAPPPTLQDAEAAYEKGDFNVALTISNTMTSNGATAGQAYFIIAKVKSRQSNPDQAIEALRSALTAGIAEPRVAIKDAAFQGLQMNPRFLMLLEKFDLAEASETTKSGTKIRVGDIEIDTND